MKKEWTEEQIIYLEDHYGKIPNEKIAKIMERSKRSVQAKAQKMGLTVPQNKRSWTAEEESYMEKKYHSFSAEHIAEKLNRSVFSVKRKADQMGLTTYSTFYLRARNLAEAFQSDISVVKRWNRKFGLPMKKEKHGSNVLYHIEQEDFWEWAEKHKEIVPWEKYVKYSILPEPDWLKEAYQIKKPEKHRKKITSLEREDVERYYREGMSVDKIADKMGRTTCSIKHMLKYA